HLQGRLHQVAVLLDDSGLSEELAEQGQQALTGLEVLSWRRALPELDDFIRVDDGANYVFHTFLFLLIGFMVLNTLLMSVLERRREFSLLDALGFAASRRFALVLLEAFFIALLASLGGFAMAYPLHLYLERHGLPLDAFNMSEFSAAGVAFEPVMYSDLSAWRILQSVTAIMAMTLLLALLPALRAARRGNVKLLGSD
ncbi:MAG: FtsX-like permease family protein, partial [Acidobacteriota bacterium]